VKDCRFYKVVLLWLAIFLCSGTFSVRAEMQSARALEIQAAFLIKFISYVKWPPDVFLNPDAPVIIWIAGRDPFGSLIDTLARSETINNRRVEIRRSDTVKNIGAGHILFVSPTMTTQMALIMEHIADQAMLVVGDTPGFLDKGGMIAFVRKGAKIRFDISKTNCDNAGLEISSKLLKVAKKIQ